MSELLVDRLLVMIDGNYFRNLRRAGDPDREPPDREPDETTLDDITEAILRQTTSLSPIEQWARVKRDRDICTQGLRRVLKHLDLYDL